MSLFLKHMMRSIGKKPLQPILLILTLTLSVMVSIFAFTLDDSLDEENRLNQASTYGSAEITVTLNSESKSRFMFAIEAEEILRDKAKVAGCYETPMLLSDTGTTAFGVATDFSEIEKIFDFEFLEYGVLTQSSAPSSAFISNSFAKEHKLKVGDTFEVTALGKEKVYTVVGISKYTFLGSYDVMVDIVGVMRLIASDSSFVSSLGDSFKPSSKIFIDVNDGESAEECIELLRSSNTFSEKTFTDVSEIVKTETRSENLSIMIKLAVLFSAVLSAAITFCCLYILSSERTEENLTFSYAGAKPLMLNFMQYIEVFIFWVFAAALGTLLSIPILHLFISRAGFRYVLAALSFKNVIKSALLILLVAATTVTLFILSRKMKKKPSLKAKAETKVSLVILVISAVLFAAAFLVDVKKSLLLSVSFILSLVFLIFVSAGILLKLLMKFLDSKFEKNFISTYRLKLAELKYAVKNVYSVKILHNTSRLISIIIVMLFSVLFLISSTNGHVDAVKNIFSSEYAVLNATESCYNKIKECENIEALHKGYFGTATLGEKDTAINILSSDSIDAFQEELNIEKIPVGDETVISFGLAKILNVEKGDSITVLLDEKELTLTVSDIKHSAFTFVLFDCENFGISHNMLLPNAKDGVSEDEVLSELTEKTALELAAVIRVEDLMENKLQVINVYLSSGNILLIILLIFSLIGTLDNLYESYRTRKDEFMLYRFSGMSQKCVRRMKALEISITFAFGILLGALAFVFTSLAINRALLSFGVEAFYSLL